MSHESSTRAFDREEGNSIKLLFKSFSNHLYLGQWHQAKSCAQQLHTQREKIDVDVRGILLSVAQYPYSVSLGSDNILSPHHLSWLCLQEAAKLSGKESEKPAVQAIHEDVEFRLLLIEANSVLHMGRHTLEDLYQYHKNVSHLRANPKGSISPDYITELSQNYIERVIITSPIIGYNLIERLQFTNDLLQKRNVKLEMLHLNCMVKLLNGVQLLKENSENDHLQNETAKLYQLLMLFDPKYIPVEKTTEFLKNLIFCLRGEPSPLQWQVVYSCLLGKDTTCLIDLFTKTQYDLMYKANVKCGRGEGNVYDKLSDNGGYLLALSGMADREAAWRDLYLLCLREERHFLDLIMESAIHLIQAGEMQRLAALLTPDELHPLKPLILLVGWDHCEDSYVARELLDCLLDPQDPYTHSCLKEACGRLSYQAQIIEWCMDKISSLDCVTRCTSHMSNILYHDLETHSALYMLHHATKLSLLDSQTVLNILEQSPIMDTDSTATPYRSKADQDGGESVHLAHQRDQAIYRSYCAMKCVMDALVFCAEADTLDDNQGGKRLKSTTSDTTLTAACLSRVHSMVSQGSRSSDKSSLRDRSISLMSTDSSVIQEMTSQREAFQELYSRHVIEALNEARGHLSQLYPLAYRVEVLENVFSLLFTTHEDLQETVTSWDSGEEGAEDVSVRCANPDTPAMCSSFGESITPSTPLSPIESPLTTPHKLSLTSPHSSTGRFYSSQGQGLMQGQVKGQGQDDGSRDKSRVVRNVFQLSDSHLKEALSEGLSRVRNSESVSNTSNTSASSSYRIGFISNEYIVRDVLAMLNNCLTDLTSAKLLLHGDRSEDTELSKEEVKKIACQERDLPSVLRMGIDCGKLGQRTSRLTQYIREAVWRFQLVQPDWMPKEAGKIAMATSREDSHSGDEFGPLSSDRPRKVKRKRTRSGRSVTEEDSSESDTGSKSAPEPTDGSQSATSSRRRKRHAAMMRTGTQGLANKKQGIISHMLANQNTLLIMCLHKGNYDQANAVIKMFGLKDYYGAREMIFARHYDSAIKELLRQDSTNQFRTSVESRPTRTKSQKGAKFSMSSIANKAAAGVASMSVTGNVEQILSLSELPQFPADTVSQMALSAPLFAVHCDQRLVPVMIVLDLACVASKSWETSSSLIDTAQRRVTPRHAPSSRKPSPRDTTHPIILGPVGFLERLAELLQLGAVEGLSEQSLRLYQHSCQHYLVCATSPARAADVKTLVSTLVNLDKETKRARKAQEEETRRRSGLRPTRSGEENTLQAAMAALLGHCKKYLPPEGLPAFLLKLEKDDEPGACYYLQSLYDHCKTLSSLKAQWTQPAGNAVDYFHVLSESPTHLLGELLFVQNAPPQQVESIAEGLNISLVKVITDNCCPRLPNVKVKDVSVSTNVVTPDCKIVQGRVILNYSDGIHSNPGHPEFIVRTTLANLLKLVADTCETLPGHGDTPQALSQRACQVIARSRQHYSLTTPLTQLKETDLRLLKSNEDKWCFYGNLINLMILHTALFGAERAQGTESCGIGDLNSTLDHVILENKMAYMVGQLGVVSLYDLRHMITRHGLLPPAKYNGAVIARNQEFDSADPWREFGCFPDPRLGFLLSDLNQSALSIQVLHPGMIKHQLRVLGRDYLSTSVSVNTETNQASLPYHLQWYEKDFVQGAELGSTEFGRYEGLLNFIAAQVAPENAQDIEELIEINRTMYHKNTENTVLPSVVFTDVHLLGPSPSFDIKPFAQAAQCSKRTRRNSLPDKLKSENRKCLFVKEILDKLSSGKHSLTSKTLEYLTTKSDFIATATTLVATEQDVLLSMLDSDHWPPQTPEDKPNGVSTIDVQSYRRIKLKEHPALENFLANHALPLARAQYPNVFLCQPNQSEAVLRLFEEPVALDINLRLCLLSSPSSDQYQACLRSVLNHLLIDNQWNAIIQLLDGCPAAATQANSDWSILRDFACCCCVFKEKDSESWNFLFQISDPEVRARAVLGSLPRWSVGLCIKLLRCCVSQDVDLSQQMAALVRTRMDEMFLYQKITEYASELLIKLKRAGEGAANFGPFSQSMLGTSPHWEQDWAVHLLNRLCHWQHVVQVSADSPEQVLEIILQSRAFSEAYQWAEVFKVKPHLVRCIDEGHVTYLLEKVPVDSTTAFMELESLYKSSPAVCLSVCDSILDKPLKKSSLLFVIEFMLSYLRSELESARVGKLSVWAMGCRAVTLLPDLVAQDCHHLAQSPILLLEQLLMNAKIYLVSVVLEAFREDLKKYEGTCDHLDITLQSCDLLLEKYAEKALEFAVVAPMSPGSSSLTRAQSQVSLASSGSPIQPLPGLQRGLPSMPHLSSPSPLVGPVRSFPRSESFSILQTMKLGPRGATRRHTMSSSVPGARSLPRGGAYPGTKEGEEAPRKPFVMPVEPPSKDQWTPDNKALVCMVCERERFSMFNRRHHCRRCGRVVCGVCSSKTISLGGKSVRACTECFSQTFTKPKATIEEQEKIKRLREKLSGLSERQGTSPGGIQITIGSVESDHSEHSTLHVGSSPGVSETGVPHSAAGQACYHILLLDDDLNTTTREDFYFDSAPSTSLCLSILELHSDPDTCGLVILGLCDRVSQYLQPVWPGVRNPEVDYVFVISMLKYLLFNAKMKFLRSGNNSGVGQCDVYSDRINLLDLLITNNCSYIPSIELLSKIDALRRLRDKLIEEERWAVAMEISTKCGLDPAGVWAAWGTQCLRIADYKKAREKFSKCLKPLTDKSHTPPAQKLLSDILDCLETGPPLGTSLLAPLKSVKDLLAEPISRSVPVTLEDPQTQECLYYLATYGSHVNIVNYYFRQGQIKQALYYILDKECPPEVFVEGVIVPSLSTRGLGRVQEAMTHIDPSLTRWAPYLTAVCKHLNKNKLYNVLYKIQLFMKDFIRAAMTCIGCFYQDRAKSYADLYNRLPELYNAKQHLESYLDERQWGTVVKPQLTRQPSWDKSPGGSTTSRMIMTPGEVTKYIHTIDLQTEVTKFLHQYQDNLEALTRSQESLGRTQTAGGCSGVTSPTPSGPRRGGVGSRTGSTGARRDPTAILLPTLLGSTKMKAEVACLVLQCGNNVHDGFGLAFRIIQDFKLDSTFVYTQVGRYFTEQHRYNYVRQLISNIQESGLCTDQRLDEVIGACVRVIADQSSESKEAENLIKLIRLETNKINAYMLCGKLRSAYLVAVKGQRVEDVQRIESAAERMGQTAVKSICQKWLQQRGHDF